MERLVHKTYSWLDMIFSISTLNIDDISMLSLFSVRVRAGMTSTGYAAGTSTSTAVGHTTGRYAIAFQNNTRLWPSLS